MLIRIPNMMLKRRIHLNAPHHIENYGDLNDVTATVFIHDGYALDYLYEIWHKRLGFYIKITTDRVVEVSFIKISDDGYHERTLLGEYPL